MTSRRSAPPRPVRWGMLGVLPFIMSLIASSGPAAAAPAVALALSANAFRPGQTAALGFTVGLPAGSPAAELYLGALLPDGHTLVF